MWKECETKNWQRDQMPSKGGNREVRKNVMGGLLREIWKEWEENMKNNSKR